MIKLTQVQFGGEYTGEKYVYKFEEVRELWVAPSAIRSMQVRTHGDLLATCLYLGAFSSCVGNLSVPLNCNLALSKQFNYNNRQQQQGCLFPC